MAWVANRIPPNKGGPVDVVHYALLDMVNNIASCKNGNRIDIKLCVKSAQNKAYIIKAKD